MLGQGQASKDMERRYGFLELGPLSGWVTGVANCRALKLAQERILLITFIVGFLSSFLGSHEIEGAAWKFLT